VEYVIMELGVNTHWKARDIAEAHNAALAAEEKRCIEANADVLRSYIDQLAAEKEPLPVKYFKDGGVITAVYGSSSIHYVEKLRQQLDAERSLRETAQSNAELWHEEMLKADKQLTAEREKAQTLVDALKFYSDQENYVDDVLGMPDGTASEVAGSSEINQDGGMKARDALAKVKEGK
jgi:hypothetical protein